MQPCDLDAVTARQMIGARQLSSVELVQSCIDRIASVDHAVNAMVTRDFDRALASARDADAATLRGDAVGPLHGLPVGVKDLDETADIRTTFGSELFADNVPKHDSGAVARLKAAGAIVLGKTNTPEFGAGANTRNRVFGATGNPFDPNKSAAGSSGGSGVALACGMVPIATGSDMGGSLRNPAAYNGIVGFRPSAGMVPAEKRPLGWSNLGVLGPMARNVADLSLMLSAMQGDDERDVLATTILGRSVRQPGDVFPPAAVDLAHVRAAFSPDFGFAPTEQHIRRVFAAKTALFRDVFAVAEDATPDCSGMDDTFAVLRAMNFIAAHYDKCKATPDKVGPNVTANVEEGLRYSALDIVGAQKQQTVLYQRFIAFFQRFDVMITPAVTLSPRPWTELAPTAIDGVATRSYYHWLALAYAVTTVGHPAVSLPVGLDEHGMPFGLQIVGRRGGDAQVLAVAAALERVLTGDVRTARPVPNLAALSGMTPISESAGFFDMG